MFEEITIQIGESGALDLEFGTKVSVSPSFYTFSASLVKLKFTVLPVSSSVISVIHAVFNKVLFPS